MGQKIRPYSFRLGITKDWQAQWFAKGGVFKNQLEEDVLIRKIINKEINTAGVISIQIERGVDNYKINIKAARPGLIIGRGGKGIENLTKIIVFELKKLLRKRGIRNPNVSISLNINELKRSDVSAVNVAQNIAWEIEKRLPVKKIMKKHIESAMQNREVQGIKIRVSGRIGGAEIARRDWLAKGKLPLQTLRADIDYGEATAFCTYGTIGVKVWVYKGEVFDKENKN